MRLTPMRYKDFVWPHNPEVYTVENHRRLAVHPAPYGGCVVQDLGRGCRVLRGEGAFVGVEAYNQYALLEEVFRQGGPGTLVHPVWRTERAYFAVLELTEEPLPDFVRYRFEFWEDWGGYQGGLREKKTVSAAPASSAQAGGGTAYTVRKGDTLWKIARQHGLTLAALLGANPQIKNPNLIYPGNEVRLP